MRLLLFCLFKCCLIFCQAQSCFSISADSFSICSGSSFEINGLFDVGMEGTVNTIVWQINNDTVKTGQSFDLIYENLTSQIIEYELIANAVSDAPCSDQDTVKIYVYPKPSIEFQVSHLSCPSIGFTQPDGQIIITSNLSIGTVFKEDNSSTFPQYIPVNDTLSNLSLGQYIFFLEDDMNSCRSDTIGVEISQPDEFIIQTSSLQNDNCGQGTGQITFTGLSGGTKPYSFYNQLNSNPIIYDALLTLNDSIIADLDSGTYNIILIDANGCEFNPLIDINGNSINPITIITPTPLALPPLNPVYDPSINVCNLETLFFFDQETSNQELTHHYSFSNGLPSRSTNAGNTLLTQLELTQEYIDIHVEGGLDANSVNIGCLSDTVRVFLTKEDCEEESTNDLVTTNAFKPNDPNAENAVFIIDLEIIEEGIESNLVTIYNRWGDIVFKKPDYNNKDVVWNGENLNGESLSEGTYFYTIEVPSKQKVTSGWVYLDR